MANGRVPDKDGHKADRDRRSLRAAATGIVKSRSVAMGQINHPPRNFCSASFSFARPAAAGQRCVQSSCETFGRCLLGVSPLHIGSEKKVLRTVHALPSHQTMPHYAVSCKYIQLARQICLAKRARDGIEWIVSVQLGPRAIHRCARVLSR